MPDAHIIVPVDGATNLKVEVLDFDTLETVASESAPSPTSDAEGLLCNDTAVELAWFDEAIAGLAPSVRARPAIIAPVARGCSGGLVDADNAICEIPGTGLTLSYSHRYPDRVEERFAELAGSASDFFKETGSILTFPGSLTLLKRFLFEEMERGEVLARARAFAAYGVLMSGHFMGENYLGAVAAAGNEHSYWMCHSGTRDVRAAPGAASRMAGEIDAFRRLVPAPPSIVYRAIGVTPPETVARLGLGEQCGVIPGGHDTCLSHIPVMASFRGAFPDRAQRPVIQVEGGTWTMIAQIGGETELPPDGHERDILVQGTVDGEPVMTARYGGGNDFKHLKTLAEELGAGLGGEAYDGDLADAARGDCFVLPNINPVNHGTGPFPLLEGSVVNGEAFFRDASRAWMLANLTTSTVTAEQVTAVAQDSDVPVVITAGAAKDPWFGRLLATFTGRDVFALVDRHGEPVTETTTLGAAVCGKAACLGVHPYEVDLDSLQVSYRAVEPFGGELGRIVAAYRARLLERVRR